MIKQYSIRINLIKIAIALLTIKYLLSSISIVSLPSWLDTVCISFAMGVFVLKIMKARFSLKEFLVFGVISLFVLYTCVQIKQYELLINIVAFFLLKDEEFDEYVKLTFNIELIVILTCIIVTLIMSFNGYYDVFWEYTEDRLRFSAGFNHANNLSAYAFSCILKYIWLQYDHMTKNKYLSLLLIICILYALTKTRTTFGISIVFLILLYFRKRPSVEKFIRKYIKFFFPALSGLMYYFITNYLNGNAIIRFVDNILTSRIRLGAYAYNQSGITWLPRYLDYVRAEGVEWSFTWGITVFTFDNLYSFIFMQLGMLWCILLAVFIYKLTKKTDFRCHIFIIVWLAYAMTEIYGLNCFRFFPTMLFAFLFNQQTNDERTIRGKI